MLPIGWCESMERGVWDPMSLSSGFQHQVGVLSWTTVMTRPPVLRLDNTSAPPSAPPEHSGVTVCRSNTCGHFEVRVSALPRREGIHWSSVFFEWLGLNAHPVDSSFLVPLHTQIYKHPLPHPWVQCSQTNQDRNDSYHEGLHMSWDHLFLLCPHLLPRFSVVVSIHCKLP